MYRAMSEELLKIAAEEDAQSRLGRGARIIGATALGSALGTGAGYGVGALADHLSRKYTGQSIPLKYVVPAGTFLGGMSGLLMEHARRKNVEDMRRAFEGQQD